MTVVGQWTGQEASALRQALRMTIRDFAEHLGVAERTVAKWEAGRSAMVPVPVMQAALDTVLARASDDAKGRFAMLLAATRDRPSLPGTLGRLGLPRSWVLRQCLDGSIPRRFAGCARSCWNTRGSTICSVRRTFSTLWRSI